MQLRVMTKDIRGAKRNSLRICPLARALNRSYPEVDVAVGDFHIIIDGREFKHSSETSDYVRAFNEGPVLAATLELPKWIEDVLLRHKP